MTKTLKKHKINMSETIIEDKVKDKRVKIIKVIISSIKRVIKSHSEINKKTKQSKIHTNVI